MSEQVTLNEQQADLVLTEVTKQAFVSKVSQLLDSYGFPAPSTEQEVESLWQTGQMVEELAEKSAARRAGPYTLAYQALSQELQSQGFSSEKTAAYAKSSLNEEREQAAYYFANDPLVYQSVITKAAALADAEAGQA